MGSTRVKFRNVVIKGNIKGLCLGSECSQERPSHIY